jgi:hypothetical protein
MTFRLLEELCLVFPFKIAYVSADHEHYRSLHTRLIHIVSLFVTGTGPFSHPAVPGWAHKRGLNWVPATVANCHLMPVQFRNLRSANLKHEETKLNTKYAKSWHWLSINSNFCSVFWSDHARVFPMGIRKFFIHCSKNGMISSNRHWHREINFYNNINQVCVKIRHTTS